MIRFNKEIQGTRDSDNYKTPKSFYDKINAIYDFDFDPCPYKHDFTWDGLEVDWHGNVFCNPPYSNIQPFISKGINEINKGNCNTACFLVPVRSDTKYWHHLVLKHASEIIFIEGRLNFNESKSPAPFPCVLLIFRLNSKPLDISSIKSN